MSNKRVSNSGPLRVGLTGGVASGKSMVADFFARLEIPVIDADKISHELLAPGAPLLHEIKKEFGTELFDETGALDRSQLRRLIFDSDADRRKLEAIMHPAILAAMNAAADLVDEPYLILAIPLLVEVKATNMVDRILVVDCTPEIQIERLMKRDDISLDLARSMLGAQATREERLALADDVIENTGSPDEARRAVATLDSFYRGLAAQRRRPA